MDSSYQFIIIGGGIVGLSTAWQLQQRQPDKKVLLLEKEERLAAHQTGHNSGVIHAGIYYEPGSLKADFCRQGVEATLHFCREHGIAFEQCGKLIVSTNATEQKRLLDLFHRGRENQLELKLLDAQQLKSLEPNVEGLGAILVETTGIVDYRQVCRKMAEQFQQAGGEIRLNSEVTALTESPEEVTAKFSDGASVSGRFLIACAGLMADRVARMMELQGNFRIIPYRGEYYRLPASRNGIVKHLIYPVPDPELPFLGVHLTRMIDGSVTVGPNAVQAWKREGYGRINFSARDAWEILSFAGFWRFTSANLKTGLRELKNSWWRRGYLNEIQKYCPSITLNDLQHHPAGIRAQVVTKDGQMVHDFQFVQSPRSLHVCSAPSPAATSAIPIGRYICEKVCSLENTGGTST